MLLNDILEQSVQRYAHRPVLSMRMGFRTLTLTYAQVDQYARRFAQFLADQGVQKGDCVLLCGPNSPLWVCVFWACALRGCYLVPLAMQYTQEMMAKIATQTEAKIFLKSMVVRTELPNIKTFVLEHLVQELPATWRNDIFPALTDQDVMEIMYTSGTTGDPKGVVLTHRNIASNLQGIQEVFQLRRSNERTLSILPLSHMLEQTGGFLVPFSAGAHIVYAHSHGAIRELLQQYHITTMIAVPEFLKLMEGRIKTAAREKGKEKRFDALVACAARIGFKPLQRLLLRPMHRSLGGKLNTIASGGAPLDPELERFWDACGVYILQGYGLTETSPSITINTYSQRRIGSVGKALSNLEVRLVNDGEIEVRGPNVFGGYFKNDAKTRESFTDDGWFKTGDMGYFDADGFLFLKGRRKYMIKGAGAQNIFPEDIETVLNTMPGVKDSCVVGLEKHAGIVEVHAVLLLDDGQDPEDIVQKANDQLASYQHVTGWSVWPEPDFPRSVTRKVKKEEVSKWLAGRDKNGQTASVAHTGKIAALLAEISGVPAASIHATTKLMHDLKFDSLMRVELVTRVEELRGVEIDERLITAKTTVADLEKIIDTAQPLAKMPRVKQWPRSWWARGLRWVGNGICWLLVKGLFTLRVEGADNLRNLQTPVIFMPNHVSMVDGLVLMAALPCAIRRRISFAAAYDVLYEEFGYVSWLAELFFNAFPFPRKEHEHVTTGLLNMGTVLDDGYNVVVFPEGQMSKDGKLLPLKRGTGLVAVEMDCLVVPVNIRNLEKLVPYEYFLPRKRGVVTVTFGKPIKITRSMTYDQATDVIAGALQEASVSR